MKLLNKTIFFFYLPLFCLSYLTPFPSKAHIPIILDNDPSRETPYILKPPLNKSIAIYTQFESGDDVDVYQFNISDNDLVLGNVEILIGTLVPACEPLKDLLVSWVLVGPHQPSLNENPSPIFTVGTHPEHKKGALITTNSKQGKVWYEPYTFHYYFYQQRKKIKVEFPGEYKIFVYSQNGQKGDYVFEFGDTEIWTVPDLLKTLWRYPQLLFEAEIHTPDCNTSDLKKLKN